MPPDLLSCALSELLTSVQLEGAAVLDLTGAPCLMREAGLGGSAVLPAAAGLLRGRVTACHATAPDRRPLLACPVRLDSGQQAALVLWRMPGEAGWTPRDHGMVKATAGLVRLILEQTARDPGIDRNTGLPLSALFLAGVDRHIARLDSAAETGTLLLISPDRRATARSAHESDAWLAQAADLLQAVLRPADRIGRIGADRLAAWLDYADHMTTAERAEAMVQRRLPEPGEVAHTARRTLSIGIATRHPGSTDDAAALLAKATAAMEAVRREGGNGWRVASTEAID